MKHPIELKQKNSSARVVGRKLSMRGRRIASPRANCRSIRSIASIASGRLIARRWSSLFR